MCRTPAVQGCRRVLDAAGVHARRRSGRRRRWQLGTDVGGRRRLRGGESGHGDFGCRFCSASQKVHWAQGGDLILKSSRRRPFVSVQAMRGGCSEATPAACALVERLYAGVAQSGWLEVERVGYSALEPGGWIRPHWGETNARLKLHLGLTVDPVRPTPRAALPDTGPLTAVALAAEWVRPDDGRARDASVGGGRGAVLRRLLPARGLEQLYSWPACGWWRGGCSSADRAADCCPTSRCASEVTAFLDPNHHVCVDEQPFGCHLRLGARRRQC